jgi:hypothetical protein
MLALICVLRRLRIPSTRWQNWHGSCFHGARKEDAMLYLVKPDSSQAITQTAQAECWEDREETLGARHARIAICHLALVLGAAWSLVLSCL